MYEFYGTKIGAWRRTLARIAAAGAVVAMTACTTNAAHERPTGTVLGRVKTGGSAVPVMVLAVDRGSGQIAHRAFLQSKQAFSMPLTSGQYKFYACADDNRDGRCNGSERTSVMYSLSDEVHAGDVIQLPTFTLGRSDRVTAAR
ncbi:MAG TPA: hypothetical protein VMF52_12185 [Steroidobacteraceae bacterium]|nr:hypothetical protein [Steroidobacteraceae bacterium]